MYNHKTSLKPYSAPSTASVPIRQELEMMTTSVASHATIQTVEEEQEYEW